MNTFSIKATSGQARRGVINTRHGEIQTPAFLPCATHGALRGLSFSDARSAGTETILCNAYHLALRPGVDLIEKAGGLHAFIGWERPILTDSGGFQAFALAKMVRFHEEGITFQSHLDGSKVELTPESVVSMQERMGVDLATCLDVCTGFPVPEAEVAAAVDQTNRWAERSIQSWNDKEILLYGMIQGSIYTEQRRRSAEFLRDLSFKGFAIGGNMYTFGKEINEIEREKSKMWEVVSYTTSLLPGERPRHLLGVGEPTDIVAGVKAGIDTFDCVMPTRMARHGAVWLRKSQTEYDRLNLRSAVYKADWQPIDEACDCFTCASKTSRGYIHHLLKIDDPGVGRYLSIHNLRFLARLIQEMREAIERGAISQIELRAVLR